MYVYMYIYTYIYIYIYVYNVYVYIYYYLLYHRFECRDQCLGLLLIRHTINRTSGALVLSISPWLLPQIFKFYETVTYDSNVVVLTSRIIQNIIIACGCSTNGLNHSHLYFQVTIQRIFMNMNTNRSSVFLLSVQSFFHTCAHGVLQCHMGAIVDMLLNIINLWHLPTQVICFRIMDILCQRCPNAIEPYVEKIFIEIFRVCIFLNSGISDLTGGTLDVQNSALLSLKNILPKISKSLKYIDISLWEKTSNIAYESSINSKNYLLKFMENVKS
jgi:hypothetical protein